MSFDEGRRNFIKVIGGTASALALAGCIRPDSLRQVFAQPVAQVPLNPQTLTKYLDPLPVVYSLGLRLHPNLGNSPLNPLIINASEFDWPVLPTDFVAAAGTYQGTRVWGYGNPSLPVTASYPGPSMEVVRNTPLYVKYVNNLSGATLYNNIWVDETLDWANPLQTLPLDPRTVCVWPSAPETCRPSPLRTPYSLYTSPVPISTHLHGGEVASGSDGGPDAWFTPGWLEKGPGWYTPSGAAGEVLTYPNAQEAATIWYHDHALGITRINVYAGLAGFYLIRDQYDTGGIVASSTDLNLPKGIYETEIAIQDRMFDTNGQLYWPALGINPADHPYWIPEFFGDTIVVNGKVWPKYDVEPRRYRLRFLNGSNARFYSLKLKDPVSGAPGPAFWQIGTDGGLLDAPAKLNDPLKSVGSQPRLLLAPGERADVIIDFSYRPISPVTGLPITSWLLDNDAKAPFPNGKPPDPKTVGQIMQFNANLPLTGSDTTYNPALGGALRGGAGKPAQIVRLAAANPTTAYRRLTLNEVMGPGGPLSVIINNSYFNPTVSECPQVGSTEIWDIINITADTHPIHLHLVQFQLLSRQPFQVNKYLKAYNAAFPGGVAIPGSGPPAGGNPDVTPYLQKAPVTPLGTNEYGWKDTVRMNPGEVTRIAVRYAPTDVAASTPGTNQFDFDPTVGPGYVWHCHIIDHEDNEMMRRLLVTSDGACPTVAVANFKASVAGTAGPSPPLPFSIPLAALLASGGLLFLGSKLMSRRYAVSSQVQEEDE